MNRPPAIVGDLTGIASSAGLYGLCLSVQWSQSKISLNKINTHDGLYGSCTGAQLKPKFHVKIPLKTSRVFVSSTPNVPMSIFSITGVSTRVGSSAMRWSIGSSQWGAHSQCASKKVNTSPLASAAPRNRAWIKPSRVGCRRSLEKNYSQRRLFCSLKAAQVNCTQSESPYLT